MREAKPTPHSAPSNCWGEWRPKRKMLLDEYVRSSFAGCAPKCGSSLHECGARAPEWCVACRFCEWRGRCASPPRGNLRSGGVPDSFPCLRCCWVPPRCLDRSPLIAQHPLDNEYAQRVYPSPLHTPRQEQIGFWLSVCPSILQTIRLRPLTG